MKILARDETITLTEKMSGTTFKAQKIIAESILTETPEWRSLGHALFNCNICNDGTPMEGSNRLWYNWN